jgi:hypothetical protein
MAVVPWPRSSSLAMAARPAKAMTETATDVLKTLTKVGEYWASDPTRLMEAQEPAFRQLSLSLAAEQSAFPRTASMP